MKILEKDIGSKILVISQSNTFADISPQASETKDNYSTYMLRGM